MMRKHSYLPLRWRQAWDVGTRSRLPSYAPGNEFWTWVQGVVLTYCSQPVELAQLDSPTALT